jgi:3-isopropylmalate/(R)-2-methylmalate dehydratase large subunit
MRPGWISGRILYLSTSREIVEQQLCGIEVSPATAGSLRNDISTDEITPIPVLGHYDERLGRYPYTGFTVEGCQPIGTDAVRNGGFVVTVGGERYGKGSSREHSPVAEYAAGIHLVVARSFERIYRQNADNIGLFTSTDFSILDRLHRGESVGIEELLVGRNELEASILRSGGLLAYSRDRAYFRPAITECAADFDAKPRTYFEKVIARHAVATGSGGAALGNGEGGFVWADWRFIHEYYTGMCAHMLDEAFSGEPRLVDPQSIIAFEDHLGYLHRSEVHRTSGQIPVLEALLHAHRGFVRRHALVSHAALPGGEGSEGISHALLIERYALPGQVAVGTDSHTTHSGAVGCVAFGVGTTDMAHSMVTGAVRLRMPSSIRIDLVGTLPAGVVAKDIALALLGTDTIRKGVCVGKVLEFAGPVVASLSTDERATLTNMAAEMGGFTGLVVPDRETVRFLAERRGVDFVLERWMHSDEGACYSDIITLDCSSLTPMAALPGDPGNGVAIAEMAERPRINIAYGGSCTAGKRADFDNYFEVLSWCAERGMKVPEGVRLYLQFGTTDVRDYCVEQGYTEVFERVGAEVLQPSCGACANCGPGASVCESDATISAVNRNFPGRSGPGKVWLSSPMTVAASAMTGEVVTFDELKRKVGNP